MATPDVQLVNSMPTCERALQHLKGEPYLAVDAEGVHLSKTGPLTLLQVGTKDGEVYLFDVLTEPGLLQSAGLKSILESDTVVKVMHSSKNDGEALYWQFKVRLQNVFDTQVAQMELQRAEGRHLPSRMKLAEVCALYCPQKASLLEENKEELQTHWSKQEGEFWAKRPLTPKMIQYASQDVLALVPEVYMAMERLVESKGLTAQLKARAHDDIESTIDKRVMDRMNKEEDSVILDILRKFAKTPHLPDRLSDITDEDVLTAIGRLRWDAMDKEGLPRNIRSLKVQTLRGKLEEMENELSEKGDAIVPNTHMYGVLCISMRQAGDQDPALKAMATRLQTKLDEILMKDMKKKYNIRTPIKHVAYVEKRMMSRVLRPKGQSDSSIDPVLLRLYWLYQEENVDNSMQEFKESPSDFQIDEGYVKKLRFFLSGPGVPQTLKTKVKAFLDRLERAGKVTRPPPRKRRRFNLYDDDDSD